MYRNPVVEKKIDDYLLKKVPDYYEKSWAEKKAIYENLVRACKSCALKFDTGYGSVPNIVNKDSFAVFIGRNPCKGEAQVNAIVSEDSRQGQLFKKYLLILGLGQSEISVLNMACCHGKGNRPPTQEEINKCIGFRKLEWDLIGDKFKIIFAMGNDALKWLFGLNAPGVIQSVGDVYQIELNGRKVVVVPVMHPSSCLIDSSLLPDTVKILKKCGEIIEQLRNE
jgi:uracil-DNA glycosylase family 4